VLTAVLPWLSPVVVRLRCWRLETKRTNKDASQQADAFLQHAHLADGDLPGVLDIEVPGAQLCVLDANGE